MIQASSRKLKLCLPKESAMADDNTTRCAQKDCTCHTQDGAPYCSESCRDAAEAGAHSGCRCGHAGCAASEYSSLRSGETTHTWARH
jgi:hypothetical protein